MNDALSNRVSLSEYHPRPMGRPTTHNNGVRHRECDGDLLVRCHHHRPPLGACDIHPGDNSRTLGTSGDSSRNSGYRRSNYRACFEHDGSRDNVLSDHAQLPIRTEYSRGAGHPWSPDHISDQPILCSESGVSVGTIPRSGHALPTVVGERALHHSPTFRSRSYPDHLNRKKAEVILAIRDHLEAPTIVGSVALLSRAVGVLAEDEEFKVYKKTKSLTHLARARMVRRLGNTNG